MSFRLSAYQAESYHYHEDREGRCKCTLGHPANAEVLRELETQINRVDEFIESEFSNFTVQLRRMRQQARKLTKDARKKLPLRDGKLIFAD